jgi:mRNA interferase HigB
MREHPEAKASLDAWMDNVQRVTWRSFPDLRACYPKADMVRVRSDNPVVVFNIAHNRYRLITAVHFNREKVFVLRFLTHKEYDRDQWKDDL